MNDNQTRKKILPMVKFLLPTLTKSETRAAQYLMEQPGEVVQLSLDEYAERSGSSQPSIIRLCKKIGVSGYSEMKLFLSAELGADDGQDEVIDVKPEQGVMSVLNSIFEVNIQTLKNTLELINDEYEKALDAILHAKQICFFALGDAMIPCNYANFKFRKIGYTCHADPDPDMQILNACNLKKGDVAISVSHSGNSRLVVNAMEIAKKRGATTICITKVEKSELTKYSDIKLFTATSDVTICKEAIAWRVAEQAILESLYLMVLDKKEAIFDKKLKERESGMLVNKL